MGGKNGKDGNRRGTDGGRDGNRRRRDAGAGAAGQ